VSIEVLKQELSALDVNEQRQLTAFLVSLQDGRDDDSHKFSVGTEGDGLPVIRANGGSITSQLVHEIESRTP
jgi:hypothetical protein